MRFHFHRLRFEMEARGVVYLPPGKAGNVLRGSLGLMLRAADAGAYERMFAPRTAGGPSGFADAPRPFVFRVAELEAGLRAEPGERFVFGMNLFEEGGEGGRVFAEAFGRLGWEGLGPGRGKQHWSTGSNSHAAWTCPNAPATSTTLECASLPQRR